MNDVVARRLANIGLAVLSSLGFSAVFDVFHGWWGFAFVVVAAAGFSYVYQVVTDRHDAELLRRIAGGTTHVWVAQLNGITVGTLSDSEYAVMQRAAFWDQRNLVAQIANVVRMAMLAVDRLIIAVPVVLFWGALALALLSPNTYVTAWHELNGTEISTIVKVLAQVALICSLLALGVLVAMGHKFGFRNCYAEAVNFKLRQHFKTPAEGDVHLIRVSAKFDEGPASAV
ncbi:hypothetical protein QZN30_03320 [Burkholderia multivorans]|nr:hypothetical protein [Burkholderia multivorans]